MANSLLLENVLAKRRVTGELKAIRAVKLVGKYGEIRYEDHVPCKVWTMVTKYTQDDLHQGDSIKIGLVKDDVVQ